MVRGGVNEVAEALRCRGLPAALRARSFAELRHMVRLALGPQRRLLEFQRLNGSLVIQVFDSDKSSLDGVGSEGSQSESVASDNHATTETVEDEGSEVIRRGGDDQHLQLAQALRAKPLPPGVASPEIVEERLGELRACIAWMYIERLEPTLRRVQSQLQLLAGWNGAEAQLAPVFAARWPGTFDLRAPCDRQRECRILLRTAPAGFGGWVDESANTEYPAKVLEALADFVTENRGLVLQGGVEGGALTLRGLQLPELQDLRLGELQDLIRRAVNTNLLTYRGNDLVPVHSQLKDEDVSTTIPRDRRRVLSRI